MVIHVRAQPVRVGDGIVRARRDEQPFGIESIVGERLIRMMPVEREAALQSATKLREMLEPPSVCRQGVAIGKAVAEPNAFEREIRQGCRRLADRESWVCTALEEDHVVSNHGEYAGQQRSGESAADNGNLARLPHAASQVAHVIGACGAPLTFKYR